MTDLFSPVVINGPRVKIRPLASTTWQKVADGILYDGSWHGRMWNIKTPDDVKMLHERSVAAFEAKKGNPLVFLSADEGEVLGKTNFMNVEPLNKMTEIGGTWIGKKWQQTHVNTETKCLLLKYCFEQLGLVRVEFRVDSDNHASRKAIQRIGATFEGTIRNRTILPSGECRDYCFYSVIDKDWPRVKSHLENLMAKYGGSHALELSP